MTNQEQILGCISESRDAHVLLNAGAALCRPQTNPAEDGDSYALAPEGFKLIELPTRISPARPKGTVRLRDAASFIAYWETHHVPRSRVYATMEPAVFLAVFDEFDDSFTGTVSDQADWRQFRAEFQVPASREWKTWHSINRKDLGQLGFAEFLQDNLPDVVQPDGASLLEMCLNFEAMQGGKVVAVQRLQDGSQNLQFQADANTTGSVRLPPEITLSIPVFENEAPEPLQARLKYRIKRDDGSITFKIELVRPHKVLEASFRRTWDRIAQACNTTPLLGTPE